ncbi:hypothetical protein SAMN05216464_110188 [Mucilaginibacter pineti]|uniref:Uncharacterized protein n=1 Tax=Mucilaginibacter pineti TaxID=1391627 RepID=A0A1G7GKK7_9SPHI|nr:hypothetical protein SAMN05216464_110188 [Mucilaginibacter pineti]
MIAKQVLTSEALHSGTASQHYLSITILVLVLIKNYINFKYFPLA